MARCRTHIDTHPFKQLLSVSACVSVCKTDRPLRVSRGLKPFYKNFINVSVVCEAVHKTDVERKVAKKIQIIKTIAKYEKKKNRNIFKLICDFVVGNRIDISIEFPHLVSHRTVRVSFGFQSF